MQVTKVLKRRRGRPRKYTYAVRNIHILIDEKIAQELDKFCEDHLTTKQQLIHNLIVQFLYGQGKLGNLLNRRTRKDYYRKFVEYVLYEALKYIRNDPKKINIRIPEEKLFKFLGKIDLIPHRSTLDRYIRKMEAEGLCQRIRYLKSIRITAMPGQFKQYLSIDKEDFEKIKKWSDLYLSTIF